MTYKLNPNLRKINGSVILVIDGHEMICTDGKALTELEFEKNYIVDSITARDNAVVVILKENDRTNIINWIGEEQVSFM